MPLMTQTERGTMEQSISDFPNLDLSDLDFSESELVMLEACDVRSLPELGASRGNYFCCTCTGLIP